MSILRCRSTGNGLIVVDIGEVGGTIDLARAEEWRDELDRAIQEERNPDRQHLEFSCVGIRASGRRCKLLSFYGWIRRGDGGWQRHDLRRFCPSCGTPWSWADPGHHDPARRTEPLRLSEV